ATLSSHRGLHFYGNSHGFVGHYPSTRHSLSVSVIGQDGGNMQRDYWYTVARNHTEMDSAVSVGKKAAERTIARINAKRLSTRKVPVLFSPEMASSLVGHYLRAIRGSSLYRKTTFLLDSIDEQIFPSWLNISERPHIHGALGSAPYDNEGVKTADRELVEQGVIKSYLLDSYAARRLGMHTTGHAGGIHNLIVSSGEKDLQALLKEMDTGLFVTELMGQGVNGVTGDYSRGAAGFWVEKGIIQFPVEEITIAGNLKDMFKQIVAVGNDVDKRRNIQTGSILIENMTLAGE
ncbi:MAG: metallopeptidase TldD-related protein, partial [Gammaproteobacteria bacterium]|nr:metallopeptidase TldD-related protein [Gammaproteobacteria bacterium]